MTGPLNRDLVLDALERYGPAGLTRKEAACSLDVFNLSDAISELRDRGAIIHTHYIEGVDYWGRRTRTVVYVLAFTPHDLRRGMLQRMEVKR